MGSHRGSLLRPGRAGEGASRRGTPARSRTPSPDWTRSTSWSGPAKRTPISVSWRGYCRCAACRAPTPATGRNTGASTGSTKRTKHKAQNAAAGTVIELVTISLSAIAIIVSLWSAVQSHRSTKRQSEWQERLLHLEEAEARSRSKTARSATLRAVLDRDTTSPSLLIINNGAAEARDISVKIDGTPILEHRPRGHFIVRNQTEVRQLGPGGSARYILTRTTGIASLFQVEISWADESSATQSWRSELSLAVAGD